MKIEMEIGIGTVDVVGMILVEDILLTSRSWVGCLTIKKEDAVDSNCAMMTPVMTIAAAVM